MLMLLPCQHKVYLAIFQTLQRLRALEAIELSVVCLYTGSEWYVNLLLICVLLVGESQRDTEQPGSVDLCDAHG